MPCCLLMESCCTVGAPWGICAHHSVELEVFHPLFTDDEVTKVNMFKLTTLTDRSSSHAIVVIFYFLFQSSVAQFGG